MAGDPADGVQAGDRWSDRADLAERAVLERHLRPLWGLPHASLGRVGWPAARGERLNVRWRYWWQAHLLDCFVDAAIRVPTEERVERMRAIARGIRIRNVGRWTNGYFDDMGWLGLALLRAQTAGFVRRPGAVARLTGQMLAEVSRFGRVRWRRRDDFFNVPANGPAAILLARTGYLAEATQLTSWMESALTDAATGLLFDGFSENVGLERTIYSYCQGVVLGAETELALRAEPASAEGHRTRVGALTVAIERSLTERGVLIGHGGGDGGLFTGILARYLALVATRLPRAGRAEADTRRRAARLVIDSAESAWQHRAEINGLPVFGPSWLVAPMVPQSQRASRTGAESGASSAEPARDLSVQLAGWMLTEAAAAVHRDSSNR